MTSVEHDFVNKALKLIDPSLSLVSKSCPFETIQGFQCYFDLIGSKLFVTVVLFDTTESLDRLIFEEALKKNLNHELLGGKLAIDPISDCLVFQCEWALRHADVSDIYHGWNHMIEKSQELRDAFAKYDIQHDADNDFLHHIEPDTAFIKG